MDMERQKETDIRTVRREELIDIRTIEHGEFENMDREERLTDFVKRVKNPYCFRVGQVIVKTSFAGGKSLEQCLQELSEAETDKAAGGDDPDEYRSLC